MIKAEFEMDMPRECHECPFQLKFKGEDVDDWYTRRCVLINQRIEYPRPDWCPLQPVDERNGFDKYVKCKDCIHGEPVINGAGEDAIECHWGLGPCHALEWHCADGERRTEV